MEQENKVEEVKVETVKESKLSTPVAIIIAAVIVAGGLYFGLSKNSKTNTANQQQPGQPAQIAVDIKKVKTDGEPFIGDIKAPVTIAFWSDYQCPFCKQFDETTMTQVYNDYVKTGKVKIVFKDFVFLGPDSIDAALAERAVWEVAPDKFYDWHQAMFDKQDTENAGWGSRADILALIKSLGIDSAKVDALMTSNIDVYTKEMDADRAEGSSLGINGTPGTIIGKNLISGAQPYTVVKPLIDKELGIK